jgi:hypothetical protein
LARVAGGAPGAFDLSGLQNLLNVRRGGASAGRDVPRRAPWNPLAASARHPAF